MKTFSIFLAIVIYTLSGHRIFALPADECANVTVDEYQVGDYIFHGNYYNNTWQRPVRNALKPINVSIRLILSSINDVIEKAGTLKLNGYLAIQWTDEFKFWNTTWPYLCLENITVPWNAVWLPDIAVTNAEHHYDLMMSKKAEKARLFSNGTVSYRPGGSFMMYCEFDLRWFPFDENTCDLQLEGWRTSIRGQTFSFGSPVFTTKFWRENEQWHLVNVTYHYEPVAYSSSEQYPRMTFSLAIKRKVGYYMMNVIIPSMIISVAQLTVFSLPVEEVLKIHVCFTCLLAYGVFQLMIIEDMPRASDRIPLLSIYIDLSMAYIAIAMIGEAAVFLSLRRAESEKPGKMPKWLLYCANLIAIPLFIDRLDIPETKLEATTVRPDLSENHQRIRHRPRAHSPSIISGDRQLDILSQNHSHRSSWGHTIRRAVYENDILNESGEPTNNHVTSTMSSDYLNGNTVVAPENVTVQKSRALDRFQSDDCSASIIQWRFLARVLDRLTFTSYLLLIISTPIAMFIIVPSIATHQHFDELQQS